jgi:hypothetical protein
LLTGAVLCGPPLVAALLVRRLARKIGGRRPLVVGLAFLWTMMALYALFDLDSIRRLWHHCWSPILPLQVAHWLGTILFYAVVALVVTFPITGPLSIPLGWLLWRLDARSIRWTETDLAVLEAVGQLRAEGVRAVHASLVAERLGREHADIRPRLERLRDADRLRWTTKGGYRRTD